MLFGITVYIYIDKSLHTRLLSPTVSDVTLLYIQTVVLTLKQWFYYCLL